MCICSSKYGSLGSYFFSEKAKKDLAKDLPLKIQKWDEAIKNRSKKMNEIGKEATLIFTKGKIYTMNEKQSVVEAVAVLGKRILFAGTEEEAMAYRTPQTTVIDLGGRTMFPGFIDPHVHMMFALTKDWVDLGPYVNSSADEVKDKLVEAIKNHKDPNVLLACQLFDPQILPGLDVSRGSLD